MLNIIKHKTETKPEPKAIIKFNCKCGCVFETDEYGILAERWCMNGKRVYVINCPECHTLIEQDASK